MGNIPGRMTGGEGAKRVEGSSENIFVCHSRDVAYIISSTELRR